MVDRLSVQGTTLCSFTSGPAQLEITMPIYTGDYSNPVADISFSPTGALMAAERGIYNDTGSTAHQARVLEFVFSGTAWVPSANTFAIGDIPAAGTNPNANAGAWVLWCCSLGWSVDIGGVGGYAASFLRWK